MGKVTPVGPKPLTIYPWGKGIADLRYFTQPISTPIEVEALKAQYAKVSYNYQYADFKTALDSIQMTLDAAPPGIYFAGNPHYGVFGRWNLALVKAGFERVPGCAINRVYTQNWTWKGSKHTSYGTGCHCTTCAGDPMKPATHPTPWKSEDGFDHWIHAFYYIKPGRKEPIEFDLSNRDLKATTGDNHQSLWQINYGGRNKAPVGSGFAHGEAKNFLPNYARLSKNCGIAMGMGLPECGKYLDEEFFTIAALPDGKLFPKPWRVFLEHGGLRFAHNLDKLDTSQLPCPHKMEWPA